MIRKKVFLMEETDENGELVLSHSFSGYLVAIAAKMEEIDMECMVEFRTSLGETFSIQGNRPETFPISPRKTPNTEHFAHMSVQPSLEKYVNAGDFVVHITNGGSKKRLSMLQLVWEE